ncbi:MAG: CRISPR-associated endonuclease Cas3'' [Thermoprotei archaeon]|nr:MAG: CRISPR-associated endonuclease Cas3'' [Thermoprotei archaeon]
MLCARRNEGLYEHLIGVGELSKKIISETKVLCKIAKSFSENFATLAYYSGVFHDIGKMLYSYQKPLDKGCSEKDLSFPGHEILSAFITSRILEYLDFFSEIEKASIVKAVLYHHQGLREVKVATYMLIDRIKRCRGKEPLVYYDDALTLLKQLAGKMNLDINVDEFLDKIESDLVSGDIRLLLNNELVKYNKVLCSLMLNDMCKYISFRRILTGVILISDTYVASIVDKASSIYAQDIYTFVKQFK